ncbi:hypothetical protein AMAG_15195, partial [Allomyces macrogynus ATCC 38327]
STVLNLLLTSKLPSTAHIQHRTRIQPRANSPQLLLGPRLDHAPPAPAVPHHPVTTLPLHHHQHHPTATHHAAGPHLQGQALPHHRRAIRAVAQCSPLYDAQRDHAHARALPGPERAQPVPDCRTQDCHSQPLRRHGPRTLGHARFRPHAPRLPAHGAQGRDSGRRQGLVVINCLGTR